MCGSYWQIIYNFVIPLPEYIGLHHVFTRLTKWATRLATEMWNKFNVNIIRIVISLRRRCNRQIVLVFFHRHRHCVCQSLPHTAVDAQLHYQMGKFLFWHECAFCLWKCLLARTARVDGFLHTSFDWCQLSQCIHYAHLHVFSNWNSKRMISLFNRNGSLCLRR